jgi:hypothetical protein
VIRGFRHLALTAAIATCGLTSVVSAQTATAPALKAAFLYNFAKFTEWPAGALGPSEPLVMCVINDRAVGDQLVELTKDKVIDGHALVVSTKKSDAADLGSCRVLFASGLDAKRSAVLIDSVVDRPVFTVSDLDGFAQRGGVAGLFVENGTMRFAINLEAVQRAKVRLSSKLLSLAKIVKDDPGVPARRIPGGTP